MNILKYIKNIGKTTSKPAIECKKCAGHGTIRKLHWRKYHNIQMFTRQSTEDMGWDVYAKLKSDSWRRHMELGLGEYEEVHFVILEDSQAVPDRIWTHEEIEIEVDCPRCDGY